MVVIIVSEFSINITGRINNFNLPKNQPLLPLFEAIVNSFHAIEERRDKDKNFTAGEISIKIIRGDQIGIDENDLDNITGFEICDNGIGFDENNFKSFLESDSTYKSKIGGKGVGRFSWLKAFEKVEIQSVYKEYDDKFVQRSFCFRKDSKEINDVLTESDMVENVTKVKLIDYYYDYAKNVSKQGRTIATKIIQHCLVYFLSNSCPKVILKDVNDTFNLNYIFSETIKTDENIDKYKIENEYFSLLNIKINDSSMARNKLLLCANNRVVMEKELDNIIVDLNKQLYDKYNFYYIGVLTSKYFDKNVDMNRLSFVIPEKNSEIDREIALDTIIKESSKKIESYLEEYLTPIRVEKEKRIKQYINCEAPQFKHLVKHMPEQIKNIKPNLSNDKLDDELHKIKREFDKEIKNENNKLLEKLEKNKLNEYDYETQFKLQISKISDANKAALSDYVAHRKIIIDLLSTGIRKIDNEKFSKEEFIHNLIFPMKYSSDDIDYESHNLWLIDERLAYSSM